MDSTGRLAKYAVDYEGIEEREQKLGLFLGMTDILCGKRGSHSFAEAVLADVYNHDCPSGLTPCSGGGSYCVDLANGEECPIIHLEIIDKVGWDKGQSDTLYMSPETRLSSAPTAGSDAPQLVIAFLRQPIATGISYPLQSIVWDTVKPCAYPEQRVNSFWVSQWYHKAEKQQYIERCSSMKEDDRYE